MLVTKSGSPTGLISGGVPTFVSRRFPAGIRQLTVSDV
jgi:hypothetical protein